MTVTVMGVVYRKVVTHVYKWLRETICPSVFETIMSSPSPLPSPEPLQKKKFKDKNKKKPKNSNVITTVEQEQGKHGINPHWDYVPPEGTILLEHDIDSGDFDWDAVKNDDNIELWLVRVPDGVSTQTAPMFVITLSMSSSR